MPNAKDGPATRNFRPLALRGNVELKRLVRKGLSKEIVKAGKFAPTGACVGWGIPFRVGKAVLVKGKPVSAKLPRVKAGWLVFVHASDTLEVKKNKDGFYPHSRGYRRLAELAAEYVVLYADGTEARAPVRQRHEVGVFQFFWRESNFESVPHVKHCPCRAHHEQASGSWGHSQSRTGGRELWGWANWLWAWKNPHPKKAIVGVCFEPKGGTLLVSAISAGDASENPLRWRRREKALLKLPGGVKFKPDLDERGLLRQIQLDMGQVISAAPRPVYPNKTWAKTYNNKLPKISEREILVEYTAHPDASFHLWNRKKIPVKSLTPKRRSGAVQYVAPSHQRVRLRVVERASGKPVAAKLHIHGEAGEYLAPVDRHRIPNEAWFEDYSVDFLHLGIHFCTYIPGETAIDLPLGRVYIEVSKGFEIKPVRKIVRVTRATKEIKIEVAKVLRWRERGWVSADTHVHFLSPNSAMLEGAGEGVNVVNLLASQWGELMTNVGDFDGATTHGSKEASGGGEYLVRVGTENRQAIMGHISLLGYNGKIIAPMTTGGPGESAIGDPVEVLLTEWARQCKRQDGVVVVPHFPNPRGENAAAIVSGAADAVEMTAWRYLYNGIDPFSLSDWYRYLNCGYMVAAVGGTDKMTATTAVGAVRTYAKLDSRKSFTYEEWKKAIRRAETFVTYGPLMEFSVEGKPAGTRIKMTRAGGTVDVEWKVASVTVPMSRVELVVNGEIRESKKVKHDADKGRWRVKLGQSSWLALLVRGHYRDKPEMIAAHSSAVMVELAGSPFMSAADAVTILEQIEGSLAYLDTVGTRAETKRYRQMRMVLTSAHRSLHNRMHRAGKFHKHTPKDDHKEHH